MSMMSFAPHDFLNAYATPATPEDRAKGKDGKYDVTVWFHNKNTGEILRNWTVSQLLALSAHLEHQIIPLGIPKVTLDAQGNPIVAQRQDRDINSNTLISAISAAALYHALTGRSVSVSAQPTTSLPEGIKKQLKMPRGGGGK
jgi:hypothetical protein